MRSTAEFASALLEEVAGPLGVDVVPVEVPSPDPRVLNALRELTGYADQPPPAVSDAPASAATAALAVVAAYSGVPCPRLPGAEVLTERAAIAGLSRNAPFSPGGAFRALHARDGWLGVSLPRSSDLELLPALVQRAVLDDPWTALAEWLRPTGVAEAAARAQLLGLAAAPVPSGPPLRIRPPVVVTRGGRRGVRPARPLVVDLTSLWAGPLCARLLGRCGTRVVKIESATRPDGARHGPATFFDLLHADHEQRTMDFAADRERLRALVEQADVVLEASRPRALRQLGLDAEAAVARGTVWASITAYGRENEHRVGFGDDVAAGAGLVHRTPIGPVPLGDALADPLAGVHAAAAVTIALRGDSGALLDVSMHDTAVRVARTGSVNTPKHPL